ncbi:three-Cys-motif partner protein TcmP [Amycolatopsis kentuckyensis]|uniref:three-Cys-motif partner protein TcmP n=1 Tax=Amycolatopsis kentuckyensis TaxID=218823 RepID=UPI003568F44E
MAKGTSAGLLDNQQAQSVFKHELLRGYALPFVVMTASKIPGRRAMVVDGYAGRGRYDDGRPASAELLLKAAHRARTSTRVEVLLVERNRQDYRRLSTVAAEYRDQGLQVEAFHGQVQDHLPAIVSRADGMPLFLFLDPCGAILPFVELHRLLRRARGSSWPRTEALLNFSADFTRRAAGVLHKNLHDHAAIQAMDAVCGGPWWRQVALDAHKSSRRGDWESAAEAVVTEYARRLGAATNMKHVVVPVRRQMHHQPVYHLVFLTRGEHGIWVFGHSAAAARRAWLDVVGPGADPPEGVLFNLAEFQQEDEEQRAIEEIKRNLVKLAGRDGSFKLAHHPQAVFGDAYGIAGDVLVRKAARELHKAGTIRIDCTPKQVRDWVVG